MASAQNVVLVGDPGTGKTHLATAIGVQAIEHDRSRVRFFSTIELVNALEQEKRVGKPGQLALRLMYADVVILDVTLPRFHVQQLTLLFVRSRNRTVSGNRSTNGYAVDCKILRSNRLHLGVPARVFRTDIATFARLLTS